MADTAERVAVTAICDPVVERAAAAVSPRLLDDRLVYTQSTGITDDKSALVAELERGELVHVALDLDADEVRLHAQTAMVVGRMTATVIVEGEERSLSIRTLEVFLLTPEGCKSTAFRSTAAPS